MAFLDDDFLLTNKPAKKLYHEYAEQMPIIDYHCHLVPKDIYENKNYANITKIWLNDGLYGDHYKWRLERANGVSEELVTGNGDDYDKFIAWAGTIENAIGNPLYEWTHLELKRFFGIDQVLNRKTAPMIWKKANEMLVKPEFKPRELIKRNKVKVVCTTDDPVSDLKYHQLLRKEEPAFKVLPAMRPDNLIRIDQGDFDDYLNQLSKASGVTIKTVQDLYQALDQRFEYFNELGGHLSDHGLNSFHYEEATAEEINTIMQHACKDNRDLSDHEINKYQTAVLKMLMKLNKKYDWTMQYHINVLRNANLPMYQKLGPDIGVDSEGSQAGIAGEIMKLMSAMSVEDMIPKTIFYSTNENDWMELATGMQSFQGGCRQKMQLGCAWWFNDTREGIRKQLTTMAEQSLLPNFVGMLTDSRSFLSYTRHEYFRRVLCDLIGEWVSRGQIPEDYNYLGKVVQDISYNNAHDYFGFFNEKQG